MSHINTTHCCCTKLVFHTSWGLFIGCLAPQQHASISQGQICSDHLICCHAEIEVADQTFYLTQSQYTDTGRTSPSADPTMPGAWQVGTGAPSFKSLVWLNLEKYPQRKRESNSISSAPEAEALTTRRSFKRECWWCVFRSLRGARQGKCAMFCLRHNQQTAIHLPQHSAAVCGVSQSSPCHGETPRHPTSAQQAWGRWSVDRGRLFSFYLKISMEKDY